MEKGNDSKDFAITRAQRAHKKLDEIFQKEELSADVLFDIIDHVHKTYSDKYQNDITDVVDTKALLTTKKEGKFANLHCALKYIQRYATIGFEKSSNPVDLLKSIHYLMFELQRRKFVNEED